MAQIEIAPIVALMEARVDNDHHINRRLVLSQRVADLEAQVEELKAEIARRDDTTPEAE